MDRQKNKNILRHETQRGSTVVEFAVIAGLLLVILFGIIEFGLIFYGKHFVANSAREGVRVGIIANNYNCFNSTPSSGCTSATDRQQAVDSAVRNYLATLFKTSEINKVVVTKTPSAFGVTPPFILLSVDVETKNYFPSLITGLVPGYSHPATFGFTANGEYEDPSEP